MSHINDNQAAMMVHALGGSPQKPYRNSYCVRVGSEDEQEWQQLVALGLAEPAKFCNKGLNRFYVVTPDGIQALMTRSQDILFRHLPIGTRFKFTDDPEWTEVYEVTASQQCRVADRKTWYASPGMPNRPVQIVSPDPPEEGPDQ